MCGRFANATTLDTLKAGFRVHFNPGQGHNAAPRWNIAPGTMIDTITGTEERWIDAAQWGFSTPKQPRPIINARGETMLEKPTFAEAARQRRCIIIATGWYEWKAPKQPYFIRRADGAPMAMAGLFSMRDGNRRCVVVTRSATEGLGEIHHRAPLLLDNAELDCWLDPAASVAAVADLVQPEDGAKLDYYPVSAEVGSVAADHEGLIRRDDRHGQLPPAQMELF